MRRLSPLFISALLLALCCVAALAQHSFSSDEYTLELPSPTWRVVQEADSIHQHTEFIYGDRNDGYLKIRKEVVDEGTSASDLARRDRETKLRFLPGYVDNAREERFAGRLNGVMISYEYTNGGKPMAGRTYYLQADSRTIYALRFTGMRDKLARIRNQTDLIARSFQLK
ncbi:MAG TPA: hypothetical protein VF544_17605 [Pyrinomonadaceae bacterium]|jgi:hypothetical protein